FSPSNSMLARQWLRSGSAGCRWRAAGVLSAGRRGQRVHPPWRRYVVVRREAECIFGLGIPFFQILLVVPLHFRSLLDWLLKVSELNTQLKTVEYQIL